MKLLLIVFLFLIARGAGEPQAIAPVTLSLNQKLMRACNCQDTAASRIFLAQGANPNASDTQNLTPLIVASLKGQPDLVQLLLAKGANVTARSDVPQETTALEAATYHRENDVERITAVPNDPGGESMRNQPIDADEALKDDNYAAVIRLLKQSLKIHDQHYQPNQ